MHARIMQTSGDNRKARASLQDDCTKILATHEGTEHE
jgi:hypothetical protein